MTELAKIVLLACIRYGPQWVASIIRELNKTNVSWDAIIGLCETVKERTYDDYIAGQPGGGAQP